MMPKPLATLGLTTFNAAATVGDALESILAQDWQPREILVVDDASTDGTQTILERWAGRQGEIRLIFNRENSGAAVSRNRIIEHAKGEFIVFFDDDDVSLPDRVRQQITRILAYETAFAEGAPVICHTARTQCYPDGRTRVEKAMGEVSGQPAPYGIAVAKRILMGEPLQNGYGSCATCSQAARKTTYQLVGGFDPFFRRCQDTDLSIRMARAGVHFVGLATPLVSQKMTKTSDKSLEQEFKYKLALLDKNRDLFDDPALFAFCQEWFELKYNWLSRNELSFLRQIVYLAVSHPTLTLKRLKTALPNWEQNKAHRRFHRGTQSQ